VSYLFDSSSIFLSVQSGKAEAAADNYTLEVAKYELGNTLWKQHALSRRITKEELSDISVLFKNILRTMRILTIDCHEPEVARLASELGLTFYDASYVFMSRRQGVPLVTEDDRIVKKAGAYVKVIKLKDI